jgi:hypothetical protein
LLRSRAPAARNVVVASGKKTDLKKQGLESIKNAVVKKNLQGVSDSMNKKGWTDPSGRKGKVQPASLFIALAKPPGPGRKSSSMAGAHQAISAGCQEQYSAYSRHYLLVSPTLFQVACLPWIQENLGTQGFGVYRFANKYGANVDGYSPIYTPDSWAETGSQYSLGTKGLLAW